MNSTEEIRPGEGPEKDGFEPDANATASLGANGVTISQGAALWDPNRCGMELLGRVLEGSAGRQSRSARAPLRGYPTGLL